MGNALTFLFWCTGAALAVNMLGFLTERASEYLKKVNRKALAPPLLPRPVAVVAQADPAMPPVLEEQTAGYWWKRFLSLWGMLGVLVVPLQGFIVLVNSALIAATLETILDRSGVPLIPVNIYGWEREVTDLDLIGALISTVQMIAASAAHLAWHARPRLWLVFTPAVTVLLSLVSYEVGASIGRGMYLGGGLWNALLSGALALGTAMAEVVVGIVLIDTCLLPLLLAVLWSLATPIRALARWWGRRRAFMGLRLRPRRQERQHPLRLALVYPLAAIDHAAICRSTPTLRRACGSSSSPGRLVWTKRSLRSSTPSGRASHTPRTTRARRTSGAY